MGKANDTRAHVMAVAERLFAADGLSNVSVRNITSEARVNLAAINYHFGSRDALAMAIFQRRASQLARERLDRLRQLEADGGADLRAILGALLGPPLEWYCDRDDKRHAIQFLIHARGERHPEIRRLINTHLDVLLRFATSIARVRPDLPEDEIYWRLFFTLALEHDLCSEVERLENLSGGACNLDDASVVLDRVLDFAVAGFDAPVRIEGDARATAAV